MRSRLDYPEKCVCYNGIRQIFGIGSPHLTTIRLRFFCYPISLHSDNQADYPRLSAGVAQMAEQLIRNQQVGGSSPLTGTNAVRSWYQRLVGSR